MSSHDLHGKDEGLFLRTLNTGCFVAILVVVFFGTLLLMAVFFP